MDAGGNIKNSSGSEKRWHFDVSGIEPDKAEKSSEKETQPIQQETTENADKESKQPAAQKNEAQGGTPPAKPLGRRIRNRLLTGKMMRRYAPWMLMVVGLFLILIYNRYAIEDLVKEKNATTERIKYLREHKIQMQKKYQESTKISKLVEELDTLHIGLLSGPPYEL